MNVLRALCGLQHFPCISVYTVVLHLHPGVVRLLLSVCLSSEQGIDDRRANFATRTANCSTQKRGGKRARKGDGIGTEIGPSSATELRRVPVCPLWLCITHGGSNDKYLLQNTWSEHNIEGGRPTGLVPKAKTIVNNANNICRADVTIFDTQLTLIVVTNLESRFHE